MNILTSAVNSSYKVTEFEKKAAEKKVSQKKNGNVGTAAKYKEVKFNEARNQEFEIKTEGGGQRQNSQSETSCCQLI